MLIKRDIMDMFIEPQEMIEVGGGPDALAFRIMNLSKSNTRTMEIFNTMTSIFVTANTMQKIFDLEYCVDHMYSWLAENIPSIEQKKTAFVEILIKNTTGKNYKAAIMEDSSFEQHSLIDCELLALCINTIIGEAKMDRGMHG